jgi:sugar (pentulose or hexulose) kinase
MKVDSDELYLGIDLGTSGARACLIDRDGNELASARASLPTTQLPEHWKQAAFGVIRQLTASVEAKRIRALAIDGTSGTVMLCTRNGEPCTPALMYYDQSCTAEASIVANTAPADCAARGASASLAKALHLLKLAPQAAHICHQADWVAGLLCGRFDISDENNALKLGYDPIARIWPAWLDKPGMPRDLLPRVYAPGTVVANVTASVASELGLSPDCRLVAGTTDSIAAFIATGANSIGDGVTSLGSTLVLKLVCDRPVFSSELGVYSHRLGDTWLAGGASNSGGAVLLKYFSRQQLDAMTSELDPDSPTGLDYYPLAGKGERFPYNDPNRNPVLEPRPDRDVGFFQGMLEGIARIEKQGYDTLARLGAPKVKRVVSTGGGSANPSWSRIREQILGVPVTTAVHAEASYGAALLASGINPISAT